MTKNEQEPNPINELAVVIAEMSSLISRQDVRAVLGDRHYQELRTAAAGFRQRFPKHWPGSQQDLPL